MEAYSNFKNNINARFAQWEPFDLIYYTLLTIFVLWFIKKFINFCINFKRNATQLVLSTVKIVPGGSSLIAGQTEKMAKKLSESLSSHTANFPKFPTLPETGLSQEYILNIMTDLQKAEEKKWREGKVTGCIYVGDDSQEKLIAKAYSKFVLSNPLHSDVFPSIRKFEAEIISMGKQLFCNKEDVEEVCGAVTSGGTESILMAMKAYRDSKPHIKNPEIVLCESAHPAFHKAATYFGITLKFSAVGKDYGAVPSDYEKLITSNTIAIVGSAPSYPHGIIDPIDELAKIACAKKVGLHVDLCLGGFFLPFLRASKKEYKVPNFDFRVKGVTSISADLHKFGMTPKGTSLVLFRNHELRRNMYFVTTEWCGGLYASPTMAGSRTGAVIAGAWAIMLNTGFDGYVRVAEQIKETALKVIDGINSIPELYVLGDPLAMVIAFSSKKIDVFKLLDAMKGWELGGQQKPNCIHFTLTYRHAVTGMAEKFISDLKEAVKNVIANPDKYKEKAPMYGMAAEMPDRAVIKEFITRYMDAVLDL